MSDLCSNFQIPASNTVGGVRVTQTVLQCDIVKICISFRGHNSAIMSWIKILFLLSFVIVSQRVTDLDIRVDARVVTTVDGQTYGRMSGKPDPFISPCLRQAQQKQHPKRPS